MPPYEYQGTHCNSYEKVTNTDNTPLQAKRVIIDSNKKMLYSETLCTQEDMTYSGKFTSTLPPDTKEKK